MRPDDRQNLAANFSLALKRQADQSPPLRGGPPPNDREVYFFPPNVTSISTFFPSRTTTAVAFSPGLAR